MAHIARNPDRDHGEAILPPLRQFVRLNRADRQHAMEAAALMAMAWAGLRVHRFLMLRAVAAWLVARTTTVEAAGPAAIDAVRLAVARVARRAPWATCLVQALAADVMLRRRHLASELRFGVRRVTGAGVPPIEAHAWVDCGGVTIGLADQQSDFEVLAP